MPEIKPEPGELPEPTEDLNLFLTMMDVLLQALTGDNTVRAALYITVWPEWYERLAAKNPDLRSIISGAHLELKRGDKEVNIFPYLDDSEERENAENDDDNSASSEGGEATDEHQAGTG